MESSSEPPEASRFSDINRHKWRQVWKTHFLSLSLFFFLLRKTCQTFNWCSLNAFMRPAKSDLEESAPSIKVPVCNIQGTGHRQCAGPDTAWRGRALLGNAGESLRAFFFFFFCLCSDAPITLALSRFYLSLIWPPGKKVSGNQTDPHSLYWLIKASNEAAFQPTRFWLKQTNASVGLEPRSAYEMRWVFKINDLCEWRRGLKTPPPMHILICVINQQKIIINSTAKYNQTRKRGEIKLLHSSVTVISFNNPSPLSVSSQRQLMGHLWKKYLNVISMAGWGAACGGSAWAGALIWLAEGHCEPDWQPLMGALER